MSQTSEATPGLCDHLMFSPPLQEEEARSIYSADSDSDDDTSPVMKTREVPASQVRTLLDVDWSNDFCWVGVRVAPPPSLPSPDLKLVNQKVPIIEWWNMKVNGVPSGRTIICMLLLPVFWVILSVSEKWLQMSVLGGGVVIKFKSLKFLGVLPSTRAALRLPRGSAGTWPLDCQCSL